MNMLLARQVLGQRPACRGCLVFGGRLGGVRRLAQDLQLFKSKLQLLDLAIELLGAAPELQALQLGDQELEPFDLGGVGAKLGVLGSDLLPRGEKERLQCLDILRKIVTLRGSRTLSS